MTDDEAGMIMTAALRREPISYVNYELDGEMHVEPVVGTMTVKIPSGVTNAWFSWYKPMRALPTADITYTGDFQWRIQRNVTSSYLHTIEHGVHTVCFEYE